MRELTIGQVKQMVANHGLWLEGNGGERAVLHTASQTTWIYPISILTSIKPIFPIAIPQHSPPQDKCNKQILPTPVWSIPSHFKNCSLKEATFEQAKCQQINFQGSFYSTPNFRTTKLQVRNFTGTNTTICNLKNYHNGHWPAVIGPEYTTIGCHFHKMKREKNSMIDEYAALLMVL